MRRGALLSLPILAAAGPCAASSFLVLAEPPLAATPSIVMLGEPAAPAIEAEPLAFMPAEAEVYALGPSMIAFGAEAIPAALEEVASIPQAATQPAWMSSPLPLVIRGATQPDDQPL